MFNRLLRCEKPKIFLGSLAVVPRKDFISYLDQWGILENERFDYSLQTAMHKIFTFPPATEVVDPKTTDLGLDVLIPSFQSGDFWDVSLGDVGLPIFWRPKVTVACRLYYLKSQKTKQSLSVTKKMPWSEFLGRQFTWRALIRYRPLFDKEDMNRLLYIACHSLLNRLKKVA